MSANSNSVQTRGAALYANGNNVIYFEKLGNYVHSEETKNLIGNKNIIANLFRMQTYDSIMHEYFCIRFIDFMLAG